MFIHWASNVPAESSELASTHAFGNNPFVNIMGTLDDAYIREFMVFEAARAWPGLRIS